MEWREIIPIISSLILAVTMAGVGVLVYLGFRDVNRDYRKLEEVIREGFRGIREGFRRMRIDRFGDVYAINKAAREGREVVIEDFREGYEIAERLIGSQQLTGEESEKGN